jgi:hypothetical protein
MASRLPPPCNVVPLFDRVAQAPEEAVSRALVVRAFAEATACLGRAAQLIDQGDLQPEVKLVLVRGVKELVVRTFGVNTAYMEAEAETFRMRVGQSALVRESGEIKP